MAAGAGWREGKSPPDADDVGGVDEPHQREQLHVEGNLVRRAGHLAVPQTDAADRRRSRRRTESASGWLSNAVGAAITNGRAVAINDLSLHGVGFTSHRPCHVGDRHWILITRGPMRLSTRVRVVSARQRTDGHGWDVGGAFF